MRSDLAVLVVAGLVVVGCSNGSSDDARVAGSSIDNAIANPADTPLSPVGVSATVKGSANIGLVATVHIEADQLVRAQVSATSGEHRVNTQLTALADSSTEVVVVGMRPDRTYALDIEIFDSNNGLLATLQDEFTTGKLPDWIVDRSITIDANRSSPGYTLVEFDPQLPPDDATPNQYLAAYDNQGEVVWYYTNFGTLGGVEQSADGTLLMHYWPFGVREVNLNGDVVTQWRPQLSDAPAGELDDDSLISGVDPDQVNLFGTDFVDRPGDAPALPVRDAQIDLTSFHHENWPMPNGNVLSLSTTNHDVTAEQRETLCPGDPEEFDIISDVVVEHEPSGRVVRTWDLWDVIDVMEFPGSSMCINNDLFAEPEHRDWTHANSVIYDETRDAIVISSRHTDQILALDHLDGEGRQSSVRWIIGAGSTIPLDGDLPYHQHAVEVLDDGGFVVFDNGNDRPGTSIDDPDNLPYSRAVIYDVDDSASDPAEWSASQRWEFRIDGDDGRPVYTAFIGDADVLGNGNVLITFGGRGTFPPTPDDPLGALIVEVVPSGGSGGDIVLRLDTMGGQPTTVYRSERLESFYVGDAWTDRL